VDLHLGPAFVYSDTQQNIARPFAQILAICLGPRQQRLFLGSSEPRCNALSTSFRPLIRRKPTSVSTVLFVILFSVFTQETPVPGGTGEVRISLIPRSGFEWNRKVPNATLSGVECHSSPGAKHRRRSTPELNARLRLSPRQQIPRKLPR
jgi:hypothetical protein